MSPVYRAGLARLAPHHLEHLRTSGLFDATIEAAGLTSIYDPAEIANILSWRGRRGAQALGPCIAFTFFAPTTSDVLGTRLRPDRPRVSRYDGKIVKYENQKDGPVLVYFPPLSRLRKRYADTSIVLVWIEGEKKALLVDQLDRYAVIGLTGVDNAHDTSLRPKGEDGKRSGPFRLAPIVRDHVAIAGRKHVILFDSDARQKREVVRAANRLAKMLRAEGATDIRFAAPPDPARDEAQYQPDNDNHSAPETAA